MRTEPFHFHNGRSAHTVADLLQIIEESNQQVFDEHVTDSRNDFASWIQLGLHEEKLAEELKKVKDRLGTILVLRRWMKAHPLREQTHSMEKPLQREFVIGFAVGLIVGIILLRIIQVIA